MKIRALAVAALLCGCNQQVSSYTASSGSLALSNDDRLLYAVDTDSNQLFVIDAKSQEVVASVQVGQQPEKVVVGKDDTIYVANRMARSVSVIRRDDWKEATRLPTAVEPAGMAVSGNVLLVVNATMVDDSSVGSLMAFDTRTNEQLWEVAVGPEPRAVAVSGDRAMVSLYKGLGSQGADVVTVDLKNQQVLNAKTDTYARVNKSALEGTGISSPTPLPPEGGKFFGPSKFSPRGIESLTVSPDGRQVFAATLLSSDQVLPSTAITTEPFPGSSGDGYSGGTCGAGSVATPAIITFDGTSGASMADDVNGCGGQRADGQPAQVLSSGNPTMPIQGPSATAVDPTGAFLFVVGRESNNVAIVSTNSAAQPQQQGNDINVKGEPVDFGGGRTDAFGSGSVHTTVAVGAGPSGIALSHDGKTAWVLNAFDHSVSRLEQKDGVVQQVQVTQFTQDVLPADVVAGRKLFFSASDSRMSSQTTGISCASCHLEGREDGHVWNFTDGPRQTPSLAGRMLSKTAPFHWNGEFDGLTAFMAQTVNHRMGGQGVSPAMERQIAAFIDSQPVADNPHRKEGGLTAAQQRGAAAFAKAQCNTCHRGETLTDNSFVDVGTYVRDQNAAVVVDDPARLTHGGLNTPSLLGLARSAPYLHSGKAVSLKQRITDGQQADLHGKTSSLSDAEVDDLVEYLKTL
ncbi:MAG: c-type cytochrome [Archangiaceae bacterium]|nr:c-type cytochrome [Archangiaceae bacterium]